MSLNDSHSSYLFVNGLRFHYVEWQPESNGQPVILLHGLASNARIWEKVAPRLAAAGYRCIALDQRGHGLSDKPDGGYDFATITHDAAAVVEMLGLTRPIILGHSWGGMVAVDYAARYPFGPLAPLGLVLVDGGVNRLRDAPDAAWEIVSERLRPPKLAGMPVNEFLSRVSRGSAEYTPDEQDLQIILANFSVDEDERISPNLTMERHMDILRAIWDFETHQRLRLARCPLLALLAEPEDRDDDYYRSKEHGLAQARRAAPHLEHIWFPRTIHDMPLQKPQEIADLAVQFAERCQSQAK